MKTPRAGVIGLGKLGLPLLAVLSNAGIRVIGYDSNELTRKLLREGNIHTNEPYVREYYEKSVTLIDISDSILELVNLSEAIFVIVPTPSLDSGYFSNAAVNSVLFEVGNALRNSTSFKLIIIVSTVMPKSCDEEFIPLLESVSGKRSGIDFGLAYSPEFIALGSVINNMTNPDMILLGINDDKSSDLAQKYLTSYVISECPLVVLNRTEAELAKIAVNNFVTSKIAFANQIDQISRKLGDVSSQKVNSAIGLDSRIGQRYLKAGPPFGGPCFPRDTRALESLSLKLGLGAGLSRATTQANKDHYEFLRNLLYQSIDLTDAKVAILGISYKDQSSVTEEAFGYQFALELKNVSVSFMSWDPDIDFELPEVNLNSSIAEVIEGSDLILICKTFSHLREKVDSHLRGQSGQVVDLWN